MGQFGDGRLRVRRVRRRGGNRSGRSKVKRYGMSGASRTAGIAELAYGVLFGLVGIAATAKILMDDRSASRELKGQPVLAIHFPSAGCADGFATNTARGSGLTMGGWVAVLTCALQIGIAVLIVVVPRRYPGCVACINVGTPAMKQRLLELVEQGRMDVVEQVMLLLSAYMLFVCALVQLGMVPLLRSGNLFNVVCLQNNGCAAAVLDAHDGTGSSAPICCDSFGLSCAQPRLFWGAVAALCVGPLLPLPCVLWRVSAIMKAAEGQEKASESASSGLLAGSSARAV